MEKKDKIQLIITAFLIIILVLLVGRSLTGKKQTNDLADTRPTAQNTGAPLAGGESGQYVKLEQEAEKLEMQRDPFFKTAVISDEKPILYLRGIFYDDKNSTALINDDIVEVGSSIGENVVVDIKKDRVILNDGKNNFELTIREKE